MNDEEPPRSAAARRAAELALVRVVHHYGRETLHSDKAIANWGPRSLLRRLDFGQLLRAHKGEGRYVELKIAPFDCDDDTSVCSGRTHVTRKS